jgi:hypothetical protein
MNLKKKKKERKKRKRKTIWQLYLCCPRTIPKISKKKKKKQSEVFKQPEPIKEVNNKIEMCAATNNICI